MTENNTKPDRIAPSELFARASELPETNFKARTLAQICEAEKTLTPADSGRNDDHLNCDITAAFGRNKELPLAENTESDR